MPAPRNLPESLGPALDFLRLWWRVDHHLSETSKRMQRTLGVTGPQRLVIRVVATVPDITPGHIARLLHLHPSTVTKIVRRLVERGLLSRAPDPADGRIARFRLTPAGQTMNDLNVGTVEAAVACALASLSGDDIEGARAVLAALAAECAKETRAR
jgi:MarR family transcriptional regulator, organic hydroperoxide resistance regulator